LEPFWRGFVVVNSPPAVIKMGLGIFVIIKTMAFLPASIFVKSGQRLMSSTSIGVMSMFFGAPGPLVAAAIHQMGVDQRHYNGTHAMVMVVLHESKLATFLVLGFAFMAYLDAIIAIIIGSTLGTLIGQQFMTRLSPEYFRQGLTWVLILVGVQLVLSGLYSIL
jgi:Sulfite exporter TauE/SafE.